MVLHARRSDYCTYVRIERYVSPRQQNSTLLPVWVLPYWYVPGSTGIRTLLSSYSTAGEYGTVRTVPYRTVDDNTAGSASSVPVVGYVELSTRPIFE